jgi:hypothetical protein
MSRATLGSLAFSCVLMLHLVGVALAFDGHNNVGPILVAEGVAMLVVSAAWPAPDPAPDPVQPTPAAAAARGLAEAIFVALGQPGLPPAVRAELVRALGEHGVDLGAR